jgi:hypothetical protein
MAITPLKALGNYRQALASGDEGAAHVWLGQVERHRLHIQDHVNKTGHYPVNLKEAIEMVDAAKSYKDRKFHLEDLLFLTELYRDAANPKS